MRDRHPAFGRRGACALAALLCACGGGPPSDPDAAPTDAGSETGAPGTDPTEPGASEPPSIPVFGGTVLHRPGDPLAYAVDVEGDRVIGFDPASATTAWVVDLPDGALPFRLALGPDTLYVTLRGSASLALVDLATHAATLVDPKCIEPRGIAWDETRSQLWVACAEGRLQRLDAEAGFISSYLLQPDLRDVVATPDAIYVSRFRAATVLYVGPTDGKLQDVIFPPTQTGFLPEGGPAATFAPEVGWRLVADASGTGAVLLHQSATEATIDSAALGGDDGADGPDGETACDRVVRTALTRFAADGTTQSTPSLLGAPLGVDVAYDPVGDRFGVALAATSPTGNPLRWVPSDQLSDVPSGCYDPAAEPVSLPERLVGVGTTDAGEAVLLGQAPFSLSIARADGLVTIAVPPRLDGYGSAPADPGFDLFHRSSPSALACASCHPEGHQDGRVWSFEEEGLRRTQDLSVGITATVPLHWDGAFPDLWALLMDVGSKRMGGAAATPELADALGVWLDGLRPVRSRPSGNAEAIARGEALFHSDRAACASCHSGAWYTNNEPRDVGTGWDAQVPGLRGVGSRGPWMRDGCAPTLLARFFPQCGGDAHGGPLTEPEQLDVVAYLETL